MSTTTRNRIPETALESDRVEKRLGAEREMNGMPNMSPLVWELKAATESMYEAAQASDWDGAEQIQTRRVSLLEQILEHAERQALNRQDALALSEIQQLESAVMVLAKARREDLGNALEDVRSGARSARVSRIRKAYGA